MTALTGTNVADRLKTLFGDLDNIQLFDGDILNWINDCQRELYMQHENLRQKEATINVVAGTGNYILPTDLISLQTVEYRESVGQPYYEIQILSQEGIAQYVPDYATSSGTPVFYSRGRTQGDLLLIPTPDVTQTAGCRILYSRYSIDLTSLTQALDVPEYYHQLVIEYCLMKAYEMDENWEAADRKAQYVQSTADFNNGREGWFGHSTYPSVTTVADDYI